MFLELAEVLDCPDCDESVGLVTFVDRAESRRVVEGRLGCPLCEIEVPIRRGTMRFDLSDAARRATPPAGTEHPAGETAPEAPLRLAALLGVSDRTGMVVLLGPRLAAHAAAIARLGDRLEVLVWLTDAADRSPSGAAVVEDLVAGVDPLLGAAPNRWPIRSGALHGIALAAPIALPLSEITRCARPGARLVVETPTPADLDALAASEFTEVASDATVWVGERSQQVATA
ncbi:hypothetical protein [Candidatus Palauibacter polyketidifaciens]|uniref:hypothetical protein n=1 Tax=Candidatus Palauibacter polyketidifaciens TaxID=3056740 RepID=UPI00139DA2E2|nr:hypothetical protein [Candidatus Palauibacter polyketidifaciens]MDE2719858.1 hypothetical protein [Candidatus Palauibacter polyketidifaciens]MYE35796.1 hypothetical protein [Gemmatimonadales bacterium]